METSPKSTPHSVKRWQLSQTDYGVPRLPSETRFSSWTPLHHKTSNQQLFEERVSLIFRWFDLWTDRQRKYLLHSLLNHSTKSQLKYCRDLLLETVPVTRLDFTTVLPRFLSLYVMSFLTPQELCAAAQVSWQWRFLSEQDCLWIDRCSQRGWFLPFTPTDKEFGAWKNHYVSCVQTVDRLTPREATEQYGTLNQQCSGILEEEEERRKELLIREMIREKRQEEKRTCMRNRKAWGSNSKSAGAHSLSPHSTGLTFRKTFSSWPSRTLESSGPCLSLEQGQPIASIQTSTPNRERLNRASGSLSNFTFRSTQLQTVSLAHCRYPAFLLLISTRIPAYELVLSSLKAGVIAVLYDHRGTLSALSTLVERAISGQIAQRLGLLAPGGTQEIQLFHNCSLSEKTLLTLEHREFWEKLCGFVAPIEENGGIDIFSPLAASTSGVALIQNLSALTGLKVWAPMGLSTGSFQNILSEWSDGSGLNLLSDQQPGGPALQYVNESVLKHWCRQAEWIEEALVELRCCLEPKLQQISLQVRGRALGHFLWSVSCLEDLYLSTDLSLALTEGLTAITQQEVTRPQEFLATFLSRWSEEKGQEDLSGKGDLSPASPCLKPTHNLIAGQSQNMLDWRGVVAKELYHSECLYINRLSAVIKVYQEPLSATLNSNRAILSFTDILIVFSPVTQILDLNRMFQIDLQARLQQWGAEQCLGDVCVKLCMKLRIYTNYLNNYVTALSTIDKCREKKPAFRAFLKRTDRSLSTHMLSLQELLLCPVWRIQEYVTLLQALTLHTQPCHPDHTHLTSALHTMQQFREFIHKLKRNSERDRLIEETQQIIQGCPNLREENRHLILTQEAALLRFPDEHVPECLRTFEHVSDVGLFLFNDALVLTQRRVKHTPFTVTYQSAHTFLASVALSSLTVRKITHTRYVSHAFVLEGPCRSWVCATEKGEERDLFLSVLTSAIKTALTD